jgi:hypothetical protein
MAAATALVFYFTPPTRIFVENITSPALWTQLHNRLLPQEQWFRGMAWMLEPPGARKKVDVIPAGASSISTGSIPAPAPAPASTEPPPAK